MTATQNPTQQPKTASDAGARPYATVNPYTGETEKEFPFLDAGEIDGVIERAHAAFGEWRRRPVEERAQIVGRAAELMLERKDEFAALVTREMGKRIQEAAGEVQLAASILDYYAKNGPRFLEPRQIEVRQGEAVVGCWFVWFCVAVTTVILVSRHRCPSTPYPADGGPRANGSLSAPRPRVGSTPSTGEGARHVRSLCGEQ